MTDYRAYLASDKWRSLREQVLARDNHQCQTCLSTECLEVHHKTYERLGDEALSDLITLCHDCHEVITTTIRRRRYKKRAIRLVSTERTTPINLTEVKSNVSALKVSTHLRRTPAPAQWSDSRSVEPLHQVNEANQQQARQDGRRF